MKQLDYGFKQSDKMLSELEQRLHREYTQAAAEMEDKANKYFQRFQKEDAKKADAYQKGEITKKDYAEWRQRKMLTGKRWADMKETLARHAVNTDKIAMSFVSDKIKDVYALNMNFGTYDIERVSGINTAFTLINQDAVKVLLKDNPQLLPSPKVDIAKDMRWNMQHINSAITQGILQGESIPKVAKRLQAVTGMDERAAIRNARTAMTGAQNAGRFDAIKRMNERGVVVKKVWIATLDHVTRDSHVDLDGEVVDYDQTFSNGLMYPADGTGAPEEVYNCFIPETKIGVDSRIIRSYKHRYEGEIISIKSALGVEFSCTPNHPILTDRGWVAAKLLNEGDNLIVTSSIDNEVSRRNPNINHAFPRIDTIHQLFDELGGKRTSDLRVNFHGDIPTSEVEIITQKGFLWSDVNTRFRKCVNKFLFKYADAPLLRKCSFMKHFGRVMRTTFSNISGVCNPFSFFLRCMSHSNIHGLRATTDNNIVFGKNTLNNLPTNVVLPSEIKNRLARKVLIDNIVSVERSNFVGHVYNLQTDDNYYFVNSSISNNNKPCNGIFAIAHNCRCRLGKEYDKYRTDWSDMRNRRDDKIKDMGYEEWKKQARDRLEMKGKATKKESQKVAIKNTLIAPIRPRKEDFATDDEYREARQKFRAENDIYKQKREELVEQWESGEREYNTANDVKAWAESRGVKLGGDVENNVDARLFDEVLGTLDEMFEKYPETKEQFIHGFELYYENDLNYLAKANHGLGLSGYFSRADSVYTDVIEGQATGFETRGDGTLKTIIRHEYGHNADWYCRSKFSTIDSTYEWKVSGKLDRRYEAARQYERELVDLTLKHGSEYSHTNTLEAFAEGFAEYTSNPDSEYGKAFGEFFERWYYAHPVE